MYKLVVAILLIQITSSCSADKAPVEEKETVVSETTVTLTETEMKTAGIELGKAEKGRSSSLLKVSGVVDVPPQNVVSVSFPTGGYLVSTGLLPGMRVRKGQAIAQMQDQSIIQMQQDYLVARSKVGFLQKEYERQRLLNTTKTASDKVLEQTQSEYQTQRILMNSLRERLRMVRIEPSKLNENNIRRTVPIYSPIDGYVSAVNVNIGKYVNPADVLFELVNPRNLHLQLKVFEKDLPLIRKGQPVKVTLVNDPQKTFNAEVSLIARNLDNDRTATVHCHFIGPGNELLPGMFANASIETTTGEAIKVPEDAVVRWGEKQYLFLRKSNHTFEMTEVQTGATVDGKTDLQNLSLDLLSQTIVTRNAYTVLMKLHNRAEE